MSLIRCQNLSLGYEGTVVLSDVNFSIEVGNYLCILGENGSGKSTLVKGLLHLKTPLSGSIQLGDGLHPNEIGYLPQHSSIQKDFPASVLEVALSGRLNQRRGKPFYSAEDKRVAMDNLARMGMETRAKQSYQDLSLGQQRRVLLARALCATRKMLLLDEPVAGLDPFATGELYQLIQEINQHAGIAIVMVSHDLPTAVNYASQVLHLDRTQLFFGSKEDYTRSELGHQFLRGCYHV